MPPTPRTPSARPRRRLLTGALCVALACGALAGAGADTLRASAALAVPRTQVFTGPQRDRPADGPGLNFLLVGLDSRAGLTKREQGTLRVGSVGCNCTDTMLLLHLSEDRRRVSVLSLPRDSYVPFARPSVPPRNSRPVPAAGKINGAYAAGGPALTVRTVERATGVRVDHYLEADFTGFVGAVDALGGVRACTTRWLRDRNAGLSLRPGTHTLDGRRALRYARARHIEPSGDLGRVRRQQRLVAAVLNRLADDAALRDPVTLARTAAAVLRTLRADERLTTDRLVELATALRGLNKGRTEFATVPIAEFDHRVPGWGSTLLWDRPRAARLFAALRADRPLTAPGVYALPGPGEPVAWPPADVPVRVRAGAGGAELERGLRESGFRVLPRRPATPDDATSQDGSPEATVPERTQIRYDPYWQRRAVSVAAALPEAELLPVDAHSEAFEIVPGRTGSRTVRVVHDRSSVEGAPVTGDRLDCDPPE